MGLGAIIVEAIKGNIVAILAVGAILLVIATVWVTWVTLRQWDTSKFIKEIREKITQIFDRLPPATTTSKSPLALNELGEKVAEEIGVYAWAPQYAEELSNTLKDDNDPYGIQQLCFKFAEEEFLPRLEKQERLPNEIEIEKKIRQSAYDNGLELKQILDVVGIVLRDKLLEMCDFTPDDIPNTPPP